MKWYLIFGVFFLLLYFVYLSQKFTNPYRLYMLFGKKGSGKTTFITKMALRYIKQGRPVFSTVPVPGAYGFDPQKLGKLNFPPESVIFFDEAGILFDNRQFKTFSADKTEYLKLMRHYRVTIYMFSQAFDIDKKIRDLCDYCYLVTNFCNIWSIARKINRRIAIVHADSGTGESHLADDMDFTPWFTIPFGGAIITFIPAWSKYFNSFECKPLPLNEFFEYDERMDLIHVKLFTRLLCFIRSCWSRVVSSKAVQTVKNKITVRKNVHALSNVKRRFRSGSIRSGSGRAGRGDERNDAEHDSSDDGVIPK